MKTTFKEVAHLYLGCLLLMPSKYEGQKDGIYEWTAKKSLDDYWQKHYGKGNWKPILRPLSSICEQELIEAIKEFSLIDLSDCEFISEIDKDDNTFYINAMHKGGVWDSMMYNGVVLKMMNQGGDFDTMNPQSDWFLFLLSKQFDLFNLIESGQAIDATTLTPNPYDN